MIAAIIIVLAIAVVAIIIATGGMDRLKELASSASIENILKMFGITGGK